MENKAAMSNIILAVQLWLTALRLRVHGTLVRSYANIFTLQIQETNGYTPLIVLQESGQDGNQNCAVLTALDIIITGY